MGFDWLTRVSLLEAIVANDRKEVFGNAFRRLEKRAIPPESVC